ncbi:MAG: LysM peptidoglycan-binding domain-containing protein [Anaerolineales bacterium]|nr:MAG: LysM peptidoglycan-binding domain-containing protein [Anaerolineales bacterium]
MSSTVQSTPPSLPTLPPLGPTATPLVHIVVSGDTLLGIAIRYGVSLDDLLVINPSINPRLLSIGQVVIIPGSGDESVGALLMTPTPVPIDLSPVRCYPIPSGSMWCLTTARNMTSADIRGLSVLVTLVNITGQPLAHAPAYSPLDLVPKGSLMPLAAFFLDPPSDHVNAIATQLSAVQAGEEVARYTDLIVEKALSERGSDGRRWRVQGEAALPETFQGSAARINVLLLALDAAQEVVGYSKWEAETAFEPGGSATFDLTVFSLGPIIDRIEILAEAQVNP